MMQFKQIATVRSDNDWELFGLDETGAVFQFMAASYESVPNEGGVTFRFVETRPAHWKPLPMNSLEEALAIESERKVK